MNRIDPRQRGLIGAAWTLGYFAHFARGGAERITLGGGAGEFGLVHARTNYAQPFYDEAGGVYPVFHVFRGLARLGGAPLVETGCSPVRQVQAIAVDGPSGREVWAANLVGEPRELTLSGDMPGRFAMLDAESFVEAAGRPDFMDHPSGDVGGGAIRLGPYGVARLFG